MAKVKSTGCSTKLTTQKAGKYLKYWERKTRIQKLEPDTNKEIFRVSLLKSILLFLTNQARNFAHVVFFREFPMVISYRICQRFLIKSKIIGGEHISILLHFCKFPQDVFFLFQILNVRVSKNFSDSQVFQSDL